MKSHLTPVAYPTSAAEADRWGFDVHKPKDQPLAWVVDWLSAAPGFGLSQERTRQVAEFRIGDDLSQLTADDVFAAHSLMFKLHWHTMFKAIENRYGVNEALGVARGLGDPLGERGWKLLQERFGTPVPLDKIVWYQDMAHLLYGPDTHAYSWCDSEKSVCARERCLFRPPQGMEANARYCRTFDDAYIEAYMRVEPNLYCVRVPDLEESGCGGKCVHMWTYNKEVVERLPDNLKRCMPETTKKVLLEKGVRL